MSEMSARREHDPDPHHPRSTRNSGIDSIGNIAWGTHFCQFYQTDQDLIDILVPYLKAGLAGNEFCMWITSRPLEVEQATAALRRGVPELDRCIQQGQIEILDYRRWYTPSGTFRAEEVLQAWVDKLTGALEGGFEGLRLTGNTFWLEQADWRRFTDYEEAINNIIGRYRMIALCTYSLDRCSPLEIIDVVKNHQFALIKNAGNWEIIESGEHRKMEKALTESEQRYRSLVNLCPDAILVHVGTRYVFANPAAASLFGVSTPSELIGRDVLDLIHPQDRATVAERIRQAQAGTVTPLREVRFLRLDGTPVDVEVTGNRIVFEGTPAIQIVARDITERKAAERVRERLVEQQGGLLAASEAILTQRDPAAVLQLAADAARELTGAKLCVSGHGFRDSRFQLGGFSRSDDIPVPPAGQHFRMERGGVYMDLLDRVPSLRLTDSQLRSHPRWWGVPKEHVPLNGLMGTRLLARDSKPSGMILVSHKTYGDFDEQDETALNQLGAIVSLALQHLEASAEAEARASEALARGDELARSNQELEQFAYVASHDLQEPLRMVTGFVGLLKDRYYDKLDDRANQYIGHAVDGANRMSQLIQDLLTYSRTGSTGKPPVPVRCAEAVDAALANLHRSVIEQRVIVKVGDLPSVTADAIQLTQLFQNLIGNAIKFCRDGVRPEIQIGARPEDGSWVIWVRDNGIGISPDQYERIFKVFQRLHTWQKYPGTGIGLAICKKIVELHGGQIWLESRLGEGSTFYFSFPCG